MERDEHFCHEHGLTFHEFYEGTDTSPLHCLACCEVICGPAYVCEDEEEINCRLYCFHKLCAELPVMIEESPLHSQHPFANTSYFWPTRAVDKPFRKKKRPVDTSVGFVCDGCKHYSWGFKYQCYECKLNLDVQCVSKHEGRALLEDVTIEVSYHKHRLQLFHYRFLLSSSFYKDIFCSRCLKSFQDSAYACTVCHFFIHIHCLDIPQQVQCPVHPQQLLEVVSTTNDTTLGGNCPACGIPVDHIGLHCSHEEIYSRSFHIGCGEQNTNGLRVEFHHHNMFYVYYKRERSMERWFCTTCKGECKGDIYRCIKCAVNVHLECIPLPSLVEHDCHHHPLLLTNSVQPHHELGEYVCDICKTKEDSQRSVYVCEKCNFIAHVECVNSEEDPPSKILERLVPRTKIEGNTNKSEEDIDEGHETDEEEGETDSEDCGDLEELEIQIEDIEKEMDALALNLKVVQQKHAKKLLSLS